VAASGLEGCCSHTLRDETLQLGLDSTVSYLAWLDELGTPITVQQRAVRQGDIRITLNYGDAIGEGLREASAKVAASAMPQ